MNNDHFNMPVSEAEFLSCWYALVLGAMWDEETGRPNQQRMATLTDGQAVSLHLAAHAGMVSPDRIAIQFGMSKERIHATQAYFQMLQGDRAFATRLEDCRRLYCELLADVAAAAH